MDMNKEKEYFVIRRYHCGTLDLKTGVMDTDIIGITDDEEYAKSLQSVFCGYEKVKFLERDLTEIVKKIAETYHDREVMSARSAGSEPCNCCGKPSITLLCVEHDSQDYSKDKWICNDCYIAVAIYWKEHTPKKICPI
jgi:hypothetical protein